MCGANGLQCTLDVKCLQESTKGSVLLYMPKPQLLGNSKKVAIDIHSQDLGLGIYLLVLVHI